MRCALAVFGLLLVVTAPVAAEGGDASAQALERARAGEALARTGDFLGAVPLFKEALALDPRPEYQCNIGVAYYKAQDLPRAQLFLSLCLARGSHLEAEFLGSVREVLVTIEDTLRAGDFAPVEVSVTPAGAEVVVAAWAEDEEVVGSRTLWLPLGEHQLTVSALGYLTRVEAVSLTAKGTRVPVTVRLDKEPVKQEPAKQEPRGTRAFPALPVEASSVPPRNGHLRSMARIATGVTVVVGVASFGMYLYASETADEAGQLSGFDYDRKVTSAMLQRWLAYYGLGITAVGFVASALLWSRVPAAKGKQIGAAPTGDGAAVWVSGTF